MKTIGALQKIVASTHGSRILAMVVKAPVLRPLPSGFVLCELFDYLLNAKKNASCIKQLALVDINNITRRCLWIQQRNSGMSNFAINETGI